MAWRATLALVLLACLTGAAQAVGVGRYHALVIGNNDYQHLPRLETAVNDASVVADLLRQTYGFEIKLLINASRYEIVTQLNAFRRELTERDNLLIYYAGHGVLDVDSGVGYWLPVDAEAENVANWISNATITATLKAMSARHVMVVADSCYSGALVRGVDVKLQTGAERASWLARMASKRSRTAMVSGGLEPVTDTGGYGHSVFARQFIEALRANRTALGGQGLYDQIKRKVVVNAMQTPLYSDIRMAGHDGGDFLFVPVAAAATTATALAKPAPALDARTIELEFWQSIKDSDDPALYAAYLQLYPNGAFSTISRIRLTSLEQQATPPAGSKQSTPAKEVAPPSPKRPKPATVIAAATPAPPATGFDGRWRGHATLGGGVGQCPQRLEFEIEFSGSKFRGIAKAPGDKFQVQGELVGPEKFEGIFYNSRGMASIKARFRDGKWQGSWDAEGECDGQLTLARAR